MPFLCVIQHSCNPFPWYISTQLLLFAGFKVYYTTLKYHVTQNQQ